MSLAVTDSSGATAGAGASVPNAFGRTAGGKDHFPRAWLQYLLGPTDRDVRLPPDREVRLIATESLASGRAEYLFAYRDRGIKVVLQDGKPHIVVEVCMAFGSATYEGGDCEPEAALCLTTVCPGLGASPLFWFMTGHDIVLLGGNAVTKIAIELRRGRVESLPLPSDRGLIWPCGGDCGCTIYRITAYDNERAFATDDLTNPQTGRPYWCER